MYIRNVGSSTNLSTVTWDTLRAGGIFLHIPTGHVVLMPKITTISPAIQGICLDNLQGEMQHVGQSWRPREPLNYRLYDGVYEVSN